ncbi:MAG: hypothetical protein JW902_02085 [Syntrophaceae bacterium]|nr:hypothetical protein [Syntrophaceae bacterium]
MAVRKTKDSHKTIELCFYTCLPVFDSLYVIHRQHGYLSVRLKSHAINAKTHAPARFGHGNQGPSEPMAIRAKTAKKQVR